MIVLSASRTALLALGASLVVLLIGKLWPAVSRLTAGPSLFVAGVLVVAVPLTTKDDRVYSNRGMIWTWAFGQFRSPGQYLWGVNLAWPSRLTGWSDAAPATTAHNLFAQWLFVGGLALVILGVLLFFAYTRRVVPMLPGTAASVAVMYLLTLLVVSVSEYVVVLDWGSPFFLVIVVPLVCVLAQPRQVRHAPERIVNNPLTSATAMSNGGKRTIASVEV